MHRALWLLLWLDARSGVRSLYRGKRSWRKVGLMLFVLLFIVLIAASQYASMRLTQPGLRPPGAAGSELNDAPGHEPGSELGGAVNVQSLRFGAAMPFWAMIYLLATWLTAAADRGLVMRPAEIHFLVAGPFTTREILTLNLVRLAYRSTLR